MKEFRLWDAWRLGVGFFSGAALSHAILLLGIGVLLPVLFQVALFGQPLAVADPNNAATSDSDLAPIVTLVGYALQTVSFFASWRLGTARGSTLGGALLFGLVAGVMVCVGFGLAIFLAGTVFGLLSVSAAVVAVLVVFVALFAIAWTTFAALAAAAVWLLFLFALIIGARMGDMTFAATLVGGSGYVWTVLVAASLVLLWLAGRLSCTTMLMAERRSFNLVAAMRDSWSLTWEDEWRIMRYLMMLGVGLAVLITGAIFLVGAGLVGQLMGATPGSATAGAILLSILSIPLAYLAVLVPAGIHRELMPEDVGAAEVFV